MIDKTVLRVFPNAQELLYLFVGYLSLHTLEYTSCSDVDDFLLPLSPNLCKLKILQSEYFRGFSLEFDCEC